ncbi:phosphohydrolase [Campylobacter concisus]|uniref:Phosphohydrolase n=1 Tax=Campylobacter concisus TaxID=199 RepID=A0A1Y5MW52_9BACT|nr:phosphohydrolase [Campylobacter concisus]
MNATLAIVGLILLSFTLEVFYFSNNTSKEKDSIKQTH